MFRQKAADRLASSGGGPKPRSYFSTGDWLFVEKCWQSSKNPTRDLQQQSTFDKTSFAGCALPGKRRPIRRPSQPRHGDWVCPARCWAASRQCWCHHQKRCPYRQRFSKSSH